MSDEAGWQVVLRVPNTSNMSASTLAGHIMDSLLVHLSQDDRNEVIRRLTRDVFPIGMTGRCTPSEWLNGRSGMAGRQVTYLSWDDTTHLAGGMACWRYRLSGMCELSCPMRLSSIWGASDRGIVLDGIRWQECDSTIVMGEV